MDPNHPSKNINVPLIKTMIEEMAYPDALLPENLEHGLYITGDIPPTKALTNRNNPASMELGKFLEGLEKRNKRVCRWLCKHEEESGNARKIWDSTMEDIKRGWLGPLSPVDQRTLVQRPLNPRFAIIKIREDGTEKTRLIDNLRMSKVNCLAGTQETYRPEGLDVTVCLAMAYGIHGKTHDLCVLSMDFENAFKNLAIVEADRLMSAIAIIHPETKIPYWAEAKALPFGAKTAPLGWGRVASFVKKAISFYLGIPTGCFVDDLYCVIPRAIANEVASMIKEFLSILGFKMDPGKNQGPANIIELLGAWFKIDHETATVKATEKRKKKLVEEISQILTEKKLTPAKAARIRGKLGFFTTLCFGRVGRGAAKPIAERQYQPHKNSEITEELSKCLLWWRKVIPNLPARTISLKKGDTAYVYSDACGEGHIAAYGIYKGKAIFTDTHGPTWVRKENNIFHLELLAALLALEMTKEHFSPKYIILNIDNTGCLAALIRGNCKTEEGRRICQTFWQRSATCGNEIPPIIWMEYVDSLSNIADFPSRMCDASGEKNLPGGNKTKFPPKESGSKKAPPSTKEKLFHAWCKNTQVPIPDEVAVPGAFTACVASCERLQKAADGEPISPLQCSFPCCPSQGGARPHGERTAS